MMPCKLLKNFGVGSLVLIINLTSQADGAPASKSTWKNKLFNNKNYFRLASGVGDSHKFKKNSGISKSPDGIWIVEAGLGREVFPRLRLGVDYQYKHSNKVREHDGATTTSWGYKSHTALVRASYDLLDSAAFTPYLLAGAGASFLESIDYLITGPTSTIRYKGKTKSTFAWRAGFGLRMKSWSKVDTFLEYSYLDKGVFETKNQRIASTTTTTAPKKGLAVSHNVAAGIAINF